MTEFHADNLFSSLRGHGEAIRLAAGANDWKAAEAVFLRLLADTDLVIREARHARIEADALAAELLVYRPTRHDRPPAPPVSGHVYVFTAKTSWVCAAVELRKFVHIRGGLGCNYTQEHFVPERKTLCGKAVSYPVSERFTSGGWPRLHELCPDCTGALVRGGLLAAPGRP